MSEPPIPPKDTSGIDVKKPKPKLVIEADQEAAPAPIPTVTLEDGEDVFADDKTPGVSTGDPAKPTLIVEEDTPEVALKEKGAPTAKPAFTVKEEDHTPAADLKKN